MHTKPYTRAEVEAEYLTVYAEQVDDRNPPDDARRIMDEERTRVPFLTSEELSRRCWAVVGCYFAPTDDPAAFVFHVNEHHRSGKPWPGE